MQQFKITKGTQGLIAKLQLVGEELSKEALEQKFMDRCLAEGVEVEGPVLTSVQRSLISTEHDEAEAAAYVVRTKSKVKS